MLQLFLLSGTQIQRRVDAARGETAMGENIKIVMFDFEQKRQSVNSAFSINIKFGLRGKNSI